MQIGPNQRGPSLGACLCLRAVEGDGLFAAVVSAPQNRVSRKQRSAVAETFSKGKSLTGRSEKVKLPVNTPTFSRSGGNDGAWDIDDDGRFDDDRSHDLRQNLRVLPADIPGRAAQSWLSCRPWFSLCRERHFHTGASRPGCRPAVPHRCPGRPHRPSNKQVYRQTMQAHKLTGEYAYSYLMRVILRTVI
jgi:hypothetical protein